MDAIKSNMASIRELFLAKKTANEGGREREKRNKMIKLDKLFLETVQVNSSVVSHFINHSQAREKQKRDTSGQW